MARDFSRQLVQTLAHLVDISQQHAFQPSAHQPILALACHYLQIFQVQGTATCVTSRFCWEAAALLIIGNHVTLDSAKAKMRLGLALEGEMGDIEMAWLVEILLVEVVLNRKEESSPLVFFDGSVDVSAVLEIYDEFLELVDVPRVQKVDYLSSLQLLPQFLALLRLVLYVATLLRVSTLIRLVVDLELVEHPLHQLVLHSFLQLNEQVQTLPLLSIPNVLLDHLLHPLLIHNLFHRLLHLSP